MNRPPRTWLRRLLRICLWGLAGLVTVYAALCVWLNWAGARAKEEALAHVAAEGETLDFKALLAPPVDPAKNFFAIEPLKDIARVIDNDPEKGEPAEKRTALVSFWASDKFKSNILPFGRGPSFGYGPDMEAWSALWQASPKEPKQDQKPEALTRLLEQEQPIIEALQRAVVRTEAEAMPPMRDQPLPGNLFELAVPHYVGVMHTARLAALHAHAALDEGDIDRALNDITVITRCRAALQRDPMLLAQLCALTCEAYANEVRWDMLSQLALDEATLARVQRDLQECDWEQSTLLAVRGELAAASATFTYAEQQLALGHASVMAKIYTASMSEPSSFTVDAIWLLPKGFHQWNHATLLNTELDVLLRPLKEGGLAEAVQVSEHLHHTLSRPSHLRDFDQWSVRLCMPDLLPLITRIVHVETVRRQALTACALERYHLQHQGYPTALQDLVPQFLSEVPTDVMDGQAMRYRHTTEGRYVIWATGFDGKDDGGKVNATPDTASKLYSRGYLGDWAWQYEPVQ